MPELPEVETLTLQLKPVLEGRTIASVEMRNSSVLKMPCGRLEKKIVGKKIVRIERKGKYIRMDLSEGQVLWFHLGMTGQLLFESPSIPLKSHTHFILSFLDSQNRLIYRDIRRFGSIALTPAVESRFPAGVRRLGPEPRHWDRRAFVSSFKQRRARIKNLLLNQTLVAGLGNIYADESLYRAGIRPLRRAHRLGRKRLERLYTAVCEVLEEAIHWGGSSLSDYLHLDGTAGRFQHFHRVYGRGGETCQSCGSRIRTVKLSGRTSSFCPRCQR